MKLFFAFLCLALTFVATEGFSCWNCINAKDNRECIKEGRLQKCQENENACYNEVRREDNGILITKRCKQEWACSNNQLQNTKAAWRPQQCNYRVPSSVCRCCCYKDGCNKDGTDCNNSPRCVLIGTPLFGRKTCEYSESASELGSVCTFQCDRGFSLLGNQISRCILDKSSKAARFTDPAPRCVKRVSSPPKCLRQERPTNGNIHCTDRETVGSVCKFQCRKLYVLVGSSTIVCGKQGKWNGKVPVCVAVECAKQSPPKNGLQYCSSGSKEGSTCTFWCNSGYRRVGPESIECRRLANEKGEWTKQTPICEAITCIDQGKIKNGDVNCTEGSSFGSVCSFQCDNDHFELRPFGITTSVCTSNSSWSQPKPCCARVCSSSSQADFVILVDSSSSIGSRNWLTIKKFIRNLIQTFDVGKEGARIGVFRYNKYVDTNSEIKLSDFPESKEALLKAFDNIPYDGAGTYTGNALKHAREVILAPGNGNRPEAPDYLLVITDGISQDPISTISKQLHNDGVHVLAIGVVPERKKLNLGQLNEIVSDPEDLVIAKSGFSSLNLDLYHNLVRPFCVPGCS